MGKKRHRVRPKTKVTAAAPTDNTAGSDHKDEEDQAVDSGNESPQADVSDQWKDQLISYHRAESIKAWKFYQACVLERKHWYLDQKRKSVAEDFSRKIAEACLNCSPADLPNVFGELQAAMNEDVKEVDTEECVSNRIFQENVKALEAGKSMEDLPLVDSCVTEKQVSEFITKYMGLTLNDVADVSKGLMSLSFSSSTTSQDSGLLSPGKMGVFAPLSDDIWKPDDGEILNDSFATSSFYQPDLEIKPKDSDEGMFNTPESCQPPPSYQPSIDEEDSAIKAVVYCKPKVLPHVDAGTSDKMLGGWGNSVMGFSALADLSTEYGCGGNSLCSPRGHAHADTSLPVAVDNQPDNLQSVTSEMNSSQSIVETDLSSKVVDLLIVPDKPKDKSSKDPVKFVDCRSVDREDMQRVKSISFHWSAEEKRDDALSPKEDGATETKEDGTTEAKAGASVPGSKPLSFAAVVSTVPAKEQPPITKVEPPENNSKVIFSTKKPTRKFSKSSCLNKTSLCWTFMNMKRCPWGKECIYAHGKEELRALPKWFKTDKNPSCKLNQKATESPHAEPCGNHFCHWRRQYLLRKTEICKLWESQRCQLAAEHCRFAHGKEELKPLPKHEMCKMYMTGKCYLKATECVYAHEKSELRRKKTKKAKKATLESADHTLLSSSPIGRLRTISETSVGSTDSWSAAVGGERVRTISGTSVQSNCSQGMRELEEFDWGAWNAESEVPADEELDYTWNEDECVICSLEFSAKDPQVPLDCNHDNFHRKCISQWLEKDQTCPICRTHTELSGAELCGAEQWHLE